METGINSIAPVIVSEADSSASSVENDAPAGTSFSEELAGFSQNLDAYANLPKQPDNGEEPAAIVAEFQMANEGAAVPAIGLVDVATPTDTSVVPEVETDESPLNDGDLISVEIGSEVELDATKSESTDNKNQAHSGLTPHFGETPPTELAATRDAPDPQSIAVESAGHKSVPVVSADPRQSGVAGLFANGAANDNGPSDRSVADVTHDSSNVVVATTESEANSESVEFLDTNEPKTAMNAERNLQHDQKQETGSQTADLETPLPQDITGARTGTSAASLSPAVKASITNQVTDHLVTARQSVENNQAKLEVTLDPPELGRIKIELLGNNEQLSARLIVTDGTTLDAIRESLPRMFDTLADSGISFEDFQLESSTSDDRDKREAVEHVTGYVDATEVEDQLASQPNIVLRTNSINILV